MGSGEIIPFVLYCVDDVVPESRKATFGFVFVVTNEKSLGAAFTGVHSDILGPPILSGEWSFVAHSLGDIIL